MNNIPNNDTAEQLVNTINRLRSYEMSLPFKTVEKRPMLVPIVQLTSEPVQTDRTVQRSSLRGVLNCRMGTIDNRPDIRKVQRKYLLCPINPRNYWSGCAPCCPRNTMPGEPKRIRYWWQTVFEKQHSSCQSSGNTIGSITFQTGRD